MTQEEMFRRNVGSREDQRTQFPPHRIVGNLYYVGTNSLAAFLVATPEGHILINTNWEDSVPVLQDSVEKLGFEFEDIEIILGSHAHADHMQGDAVVKGLTGGQVIAMAQDVPALERMRPGDRPHPIDRVLQDGDEVSPRWLDAGRATDTRSFQGMHHLDDDGGGRGGRPVLRSRDHRQHG